MNEPHVTVLVPVGEFHSDFLRKALRSVIDQTCPRWRLFVIADDKNFAAVTKALRDELADPRIDIIRAPKAQLAPKLNAGMKCASSDFLALLLGDDMWSSAAIQVLTEYLDRFPEVDLLHSSRMFIDKNDKPISSVYYSREKVGLKDFVTTSPIKHLLCWRKDKALALGGFDESINYVGPDDYDFPWSMAEAQAVFKSIKECLYLIRDHREHYRLTTHVPRSWQIRETKRIMRKHGVAKSDIRKRITSAKQSYLRQCLYRSTLDRWIKKLLAHDAHQGWREPYR